MNPLAYPILIVDDDKDLSTLLAHSIARAGFRVATADNLESARKCLAEVKPKVVLLDNNLPDGLGVDFIDYIKGFDYRIKIIMITADTTPTTKEIATREGVQCFMNKPFSIDHLKREIDAVVAPPTY